MVSGIWKRNHGNGNKIWERGIQEINYKVSNNNNNNNENDDIKGKTLDFLVRGDYS